MREQKEQEKQNELLRVVAEQNHERLIEYDVKEDRAVVYAIENDRFEVLFDIEDYVKKNHYGSVFIDPEDKKVFRRAIANRGDAVIYGAGKYGVMGATARFFHAKLYSPEGRQGLEYFYSRGLTDDTIRHFLSTVIPFLPAK